jgi:acyl-CoA reductase-like NAD-dependent aldehyde dehydrogenase
MTEYGLLIGGELVPGDATMEVVNPATGDAFVTVPRASSRQADEAIAAAKAAFSGWSDISIEGSVAKIGGSQR